MTIECTENNPNDPGKFRTNADNEKDHICYRTYNTFLSKRIPNENEMESVLGKKKGKEGTFGANLELKELIKKMALSILNEQLADLMHKAISPIQSPKTFGGRVKSARARFLLG